MKIFLISALLIISACSSKTEKNLPSTVAQAVSSEYRSSENKKRDQYRNPEKTLELFGVKPHMTVLEIAPGAGWYLEILAPLLAEEGKYIMASPSATKPYQIANEEKIKSWMKKYPEVSQNMETAVFAPPSDIKLPKKGSVDMVLTFRNVHNWMTVRGHRAAFKAFYDVLRPGGILGVVEHRAPPGKTDPLARSGYVTQKEVIRMATDAGFRLVGSSEINANPKDTANHPSGVWTLPPSLRLGDQDRAKYQAIGESDRMTLKFVK